MGINYFIKKGQCVACKKFESELHIGKRSFGWRFLFKTSERHPSVHLLLKYIENNKNSIYDNCGNKVSYTEFKKALEYELTDKRHSVFAKEENGYDFTDAVFS